MKDTYYAALALTIAFDLYETSYIICILSWQQWV